MTIQDAAAAAGAPEEAAKPITLVSFDVDGTLIHSVGGAANKLHKEAFAVGLQRVFGLDTSIDVVEHHGSTDPLIILKVLAHHGIPQEEALPRLKEVEAAMVAHFQAQAQERAGVGLELLPGVKQLLAALKARRDVATCLVTGNLEPVGWGKMRALGIDHLFTQPPFGGFGSDLCSGNVAESWRDRCEFVKLAVQRAAQRSPGGVKACFHVGDTPMDIQAALGAGKHVTAVGVATGVYSRQQLLEAAAGAGGGATAAAADAAPGRVVILDSLKDLGQVLAALQLGE